jgi:hypothetical protein
MVKKRGQSRTNRRGQSASVRGTSGLPDMRKNPERVPAGNTATVSRGRIANLGKFAHGLKQR